MIGLDTNVLIRYLAQDDPAQSKAAAVFIEKNCTKDQPGIINHIVLCETVWVLKKAYKYNKKIIIDVLKSILTVSEFEIPNRDIVDKAFEKYKEGKADFSDYLIGEINCYLKADYTVTFDKKTILNANFKLLK